MCHCDVGSCTAELCEASINGIWTVDYPNHCTNCNSATANEALLSSSTTSTAESSTPTMATEGHSTSDSNINDISPSSTSSTSTTTTTTTSTSSEDEDEGKSSLTMSNDDTISTSSFFSDWFGGSNGVGKGSSSNDGIPVSYLIIGISIIAMIISIGCFIIIIQPNRNHILGISGG